MAAPDDDVAAGARTPSGEPGITKADYEAMAHLRYVLRRFLRFSEQSARQAGLTPQQHHLLLAVKGFPGRDWATVGELAERLQVRHNSAVGIVDRCELAGLAERRPNPDDRRQVRVHLTPLGERVLAGLSRQNRGELAHIRRAIRPLLAEIDAPPQDPA